MLNTNKTPVRLASPEELDAFKEMQLKIAIQLGIADLIAGQVSSSENVIERLRKRITL